MQAAELLVQVRREMYFYSISISNSTSAASGMLSYLYVALYSLAICHISDA